MTTPVAAAASVPSSFTSTYALWTTSLIRRSCLPSIPEKSAELVNAVGIPIAPRTAGSEYWVSSWNFGKNTLTCWIEADCSRTERFSGLRYWSAALRVSGIIICSLHHFDGGCSIGRHPEPGILRHVRIELPLPCTFKVHRIRDHEPGQGSNRTRWQEILYLIVRLLPDPAVDREAGVVRLAGKVEVGGIG